MNRKYGNQKETSIPTNTIAKDQKIENEHTDYEDDDFNDDIDQVLSMLDEEPSVPVKRINDIIDTTLPSKKLAPLAIIKPLAPISKPLVSLAPLVSPSTPISVATTNAALPPLLNDTAVNENSHQDQQQDVSFTRKHSRKGWDDEVEKQDTNDFDKGDTESNSDIVQSDLDLEFENDSLDLP